MTSATSACASAAERARENLLRWEVDLGLPAHLGLGHLVQALDWDGRLFDAELEQQVMDFQRQHRLEADGLAGQKTQIIINTLLALGDRPRLTSIN